MAARASNGLACRAWRQQEGAEGGGDLSEASMVMPRGPHLPKDRMWRRGVSISRMKRWVWIWGAPVPIP